MCFVKLYCSLSKKLNLNLDKLVSDAKYTRKASGTVNRLTLELFGCDSHTSFGVVWADFNGAKGAACILDN